DRTVVPQRGENAVERLEDVVDLVGQDLEVVRIAVEVVVGGAGQGEVAVRHQEQAATVDAVSGDGEVAEAPVVDDVDALGRAELDGDPRQPPELSRPGAGGV